MKIKYLNYYKQDMDYIVHYLPKNFNNITKRGECWSVGYNITEEYSYGQEVVYPAKYIYTCASIGKAVLRLVSVKR